jgi:hypothetical protein
LTGPDFHRLDFLEKFHRLNSDPPLPRFSQRDRPCTQIIAAVRTTLTGVDMRRIADPSLPRPARRKSDKSGSSPRALTTEVTEALGCAERAAADAEAPLRQRKLYSRRL